ncbi:3-oxoacyl-[acyl-carrier-protein] synthase-1/3-oxoacyl-[acyl-carrier-protein] synthase II [Elusimicrobium posterum]|uniref:beta-ketoacyl-[acyl-carrier-protein] synthase family protein n=1 Tax=Elusimicrobium posterum TaxID=3116653 RepID=UPI003C751D00
MKVSVTGIGCVCALGDNVAEVTKNIYGGASVAPTLPAARLESVYTKDYPVFQVSENILKQKNKDESYGQLFLRLSIDEALAQAGYTKEELKKLKVGVIAGTSVDASFNCFDFYKAWHKGEDTSYTPLLHYFNTPLSGSIQKSYGLTGPEMTITTACAGGTDAIGIGAQWIAQGICDVVIACAADEINMIPYTGFIRLMIAGTEPCKPFSSDRKGINLGEGAGVFILQSDKMTEAKKSKSLGWVLGYGTCCDAYHPTAPDPEGRGLKKALFTALDSAGAKACDCAFINAHGTGTQDNDAAEAKIFAYNLPGVPVMATKSYTGHTLGAAGAVEAVLSLIALNKRIIPKANFFKHPDPDLNGIVPVLENTPVKEGLNIALSDSLAFGGCNSVIVLGGENYGK